MRIQITGLTPEEQRILAVIVHTSDKYEVTILRLAGAMGQEGEESGARWLVRKVIARRRGTSL